ncbi:hypothetical protein [Rhodococcus sp. T9N]|uniref:hypothetical protein n=1 Tax=Rhodococcus sp. T9N TaxID=627445 RepID=UPI0021C305A2|nr:hypothetical protein [Rhodococcus sp. T9N]
MNVAPSSLAVQLSRGPRGFGIGQVETDSATDELVFKLDDELATEVGRAVIPEAEVTDATVADLVATGAATKAFLDDTYAPLTFVDVEAFRNVGSTDASDDVCIQKAITFAKTLGIGRVRLTKSSYTCRKQINFAGVYGLVFEGLGREQTTVTFTGTLADNSVMLGAGFTCTGSGGGCGDITFRSFTVQGTLVDDTNGIPRRSRTKSGGGGVAQPFSFKGDLQPTATGDVDPSLYPISNIRIDDVTIKNANQSWLLSGIRGDATVTNTLCVNTMDPSWIFCEHAVAHNLRTINGHDNGFSFSRGNKSVTASNLYAENCAAYGIWLGGFIVNGNANDYGPTCLNITNISATNCAIGGVYLDDAPRNGKVTGIFVKGILRGTVSGDFGDSSAGTGIRIGGSPSNDLPNQTAVATNLEISEFMLIDCAKGGIVVSGAQDVSVRNGMIVNPGSLNDYAGTLISSTSTAENFGIAAKPGSTSKITRFSATNVTVVDTRTTPLANYAIYLTGSADPTWSNVRGVNTRQAVSNSSSIYTEHAGGSNYLSSIRAVGGVIAGGSTSSGNAPGFDMNGAPGSRRRMKWQTAAVDRWGLEVDGIVESGSNAGSGWALRAYSDAGALLYEPLTAKRSTGTVALRPVATGARPAANAAGVGAMLYDSTLGKPIFSDGSVWRDALGTAV